MASDRDPRDIGDVGDFGIRQSRMIHNLHLEHRGMSLVTPRADEALFEVDGLFTTNDLQLLACESAWDAGELMIVKEDVTDEVRIGWIGNSGSVLNQVLPAGDLDWCIARFANDAIVSNGNSLHIARKGVTGIDIETLDVPLEGNVTASGTVVLDPAGTYRYGYCYTFKTPMSETTAVTHTFGGGGIARNTREIRVTTSAGGGASGLLIVDAADVPVGATHVRLYRTQELNGVGTVPAGSPGIYYLISETPIATATTTGCDWFSVADTVSIANPITDSPYRLKFPAAKVMRITAAFTFVADQNILYYCGAAQSDNAMGYYYPEQMLTFPDTITALREAQGWLVIFTNTTTWRLPLTRADDPSQNPYAAIGIDAPLLRDPVLCDRATGLKFQHRHSLVELPNGYLFGCFSNGGVHKFNGATYGRDLSAEKISDILYPIITSGSTKLCAAYSSDGAVIVWDALAANTASAYIAWMDDEAVGWTTWQAWLGETKIPQCRLPETVGGNAYSSNGEPFIVYISRRHVRGKQLTHGSFDYNLSLQWQVDFGAHYGNLLGYFSRHTESHAFYRRLDANPLEVSAELYDSEGTLLATKTEVGDSQQITLNDQYDAIHWYMISFKGTGGALSILQFDTTVQVFDRNDDTEIPQAESWSLRPYGYNIATVGGNGITSAIQGPISVFNAVDVPISTAQPQLLWANGLNAIQLTSGGMEVADMFAIPLRRLVNRWIPDAAAAAFSIWFKTGTILAVAPGLSITISDAGSDTITVNGVVTTTTFATDWVFVQCYWDGTAWRLRVNGTAIGSSFSTTRPDVGHYDFVIQGTGTFTAASYTGDLRGAAMLASPGLFNAHRDDYRTYILSM